MEELKIRISIFSDLRILVCQWVSLKWFGHWVLFGYHWVDSFTLFIF